MDHPYLGPSVYRVQTLVVQNREAYIVETFKMNLVMDHINLGPHVYMVQALLVQNREGYIVETIKKNWEPE